MIGHLLAFGNRDGWAVPAFTFGSAFAGGVLGNATPLPAAIMHPLAAALAGLACAGGIVWAGFKNRESSGEVHYDPVTDKPVVTGENSGAYWFIPLFVWPVFAAPLAFAMALGIAQYGQERTAQLNARAEPTPAEEAAIGVPPPPAS